MAGGVGPKGGEARVPADSMLLYPLKDFRQRKGKYIPEAWKVDQHRVQKKGWRRCRGYCKFRDSLKMQVGQRRLKWEE